MTSPLQRDVVEVIIGGVAKGKKVHLRVLVLSCGEAIKQENSFLGIPISATKYNDEFNFVIEQSMLEDISSPIGNECNARMHVIESFDCNTINPKGYKNQLDPLHFKSILVQINALTFGQPVEHTDDF